MTYRRKLPSRRHAETFEFEFDNLKFRGTVGFFEDTSEDNQMAPAELFLNGTKMSSPVDLLVCDAAIAISLALQYGCPFYRLRKAMKRSPGGAPLSPLGRLLDLVYKEHGRK